ncbi:VanZ family protein [Aureimonas fodinaquatilis]|uniref:VanZ family protein n=1 Tax=Aureimonas fodinaquatilis TaxID=2565783 RepID=A0A5B0DZK6_9HYPH|nr:VanZ family protein [Aureimonas fodinaquatilis]
MSFLTRSAAWCALFAVAYVTLSPIELRPVSPVPVNVERLLAFLIIGALFGAGYWRKLILVLALIVLVAAGLEFAQEFVPGRHGRVSDFAFKAVGAALGAAVAALAVKWLAERR